MTRFDLLTKDVDTLAAGMYGLLEETETIILDKIYLLTGITIDRVSLAPEIRIAQIKDDLMQEVDDGGTT